MVERGLDSAGSRDKLQAFVSTIMIFRVPGGIEAQRNTGNRIWLGMSFTKTSLDSSPPLS
jgi:hypothetical protein